MDLEWDERHGMYWPVSGQGQLAGICECGDEPRGSIKLGKFLGWLGDYWLLSKDSAAWSQFTQFHSLFGINGRADKKVPLQSLFMPLYK